MKDINHKPLKVNSTDNGSIYLPHLIELFKNSPAELLSKLSEVDERDKLSLLNDIVHEAAKAK